MATFFRSKPKAPCTAKGLRIYAIGDIHGRYDLFHRLMARIIAHWESCPRFVKRVELVLLGDVIDRGPESARCLKLVHSLNSLSAVRLLKGNHEDLLLKSIAGNAIAQQIWLENGGDAFLTSFGIEKARPDEDSFDFGDRIGRAVPAPLIDMLEQAPLLYRSRDYVFVHAGVKPGVALHKQAEEDLLFIREEFTQSSRWHDAVIVHGHSIVDQVQIHANRIAVDTGAYDSGRLSCICLEGRRREVLHT